MFLKILRMSEHQFTKELNFRRFEKTRNGGIISDVLKNTALPSFSKLVSLTSRAISAAKLNVQNSTLIILNIEKQLGNAVKRRHAFNQRFHKH